MRPPVCTPTSPARWLPLRGDRSAVWPPSRRGPPGHDLAVPSRLDRGRHRRVAGLRSVHGAPLDPPRQPARGGRACRPAPTGTATPGQPQAWRPHPPAADPAQGVGDRSAVPAAWPSRPQPADPAPARRRGGLVAAAPAGGQGRSRPRCGPGRVAPAACRVTRGDGGAGRGRDPRQPAALGARHLDPARAAPGGHDPGQGPATDDLWRGGPGLRAVLPPGDPQGGQRHLHRLLRATPGQPTPRRRWWR